MFQYATEIIGTVAKITFEMVVMNNNLTVTNDELTATNDEMIVTDDKLIKIKT